jgi:DNA-binding beta-propeller fold protein YncE
LVGAAVVAAFAMTGKQAQADDPNSAPNPYQVVENWAKLPDGRHWGMAIGVDVDRDGTSLWVFDRCGGKTCVGSSVAPIQKFDATGRQVVSFGSGLINWPHGLFAAPDGSVWITDGQAGNNKGETVLKFAPDGRVLMTLGKPGVAGDGHDELNGPSDVLVAPNGDIFVADGHGTVAPDLPPDTITRIIKFTPDGKFIKAWGSLGSGKSQFRNPHALVFDSKGRLLVADRVNGRIQVFDQTGKWLTEYHAFNHPSGLFILPDDTLYATDYNSEGQKGIYIGSAKTGQVKYFVPDAEAGEGVALGPDGTLYGATPTGITRFLPKNRQ